MEPPHMPVSRKGDMITKLNGVTIATGAEMVGQIATYSPGDKITAHL